VFTAPNGLQLAEMGSGTDLFTVSGGMWSTFGCSSPSCSGVYVG
jgi:hypothetical protein